MDSRDVVKAERLGLDDMDLAVAERIRFSRCEVNFRLTPSDLSCPDSAFGLRVGHGEVF